MHEIKTRRKALNWTQEMLASAAGCRQCIISEIENGRHNGGRFNRAKLEKALTKAEAAHKKSSATQE